MTDAELAAIRKRVQKATPGPWRCWNAWGRQPDDLMNVERIGPKEGDGIWGVPDIVGYADTLQFIAHAHEDVPALLAEVHRLTAENKLLREHGVVIDG